MKSAVLGCAQIVTMAGPDRPRTGPEMRDLRIIEDGGLLVENGLISAVGPRSQIEPLVGDADVIDADGKCLLPGFVDAHTHPVFGGNRVEEYERRASGATYEEIAASGGGIRSTMRATRDASEDQLVSSGLRYAYWFLRGGTTTVEAKSGYGLSLGDELKILRAIKRLDSQTPLRYVPTLLGAHAFPPEFAENKEGYVEHLVSEVIPAVAEQGLAEFCDAFCEQNYFDREMTLRVLNAAKRAGLQCRLHADQLTLNGGAELAASLGCKTADHLEQTDSAGILAMKAAGVQPVLLPASVYALGLKRYPAAREMIDAGLAVVLATDFNPGSSPTTSMPMVMSLACTQMKMTPAEALTACTINAAHSLNRGDRLGSIEVGKVADFVIHDVADYREIPYFFGMQHASRVFASGREVAL